MRPFTPWCCREIVVVAAHGLARIWLLAAGAAVGHAWWFQLAYRELGAEGACIIGMLEMNGIGRPDSFVDFVELSLEL